MSQPMATEPQEGCMLWSGVGEVSPPLTRSPLLDFNHNQYYKNIY